MFVRQEAISIEALAIVGLVFLPLSFAASLFGMLSLFELGEQQGWVFFVVAAPLCALAFGVYFIFGGSWTRSYRFQLSRSSSRQRGDDAC